MFIMFSYTEHEVRRLFAFIEQKTTEKALKGDLWAIDTDREDEDTQAWNRKFPYEKTFGSLLSPCSSFDELVLHRTSEGKTAFFLDLFGSGQFIAHSKAASGVLGIRSKDIMDSRKIVSRPPSWEVIEGNIFDLCSLTQSMQLPSSFLKSKIRAYLNKKETDYFDIITCRPFGPFENNRGDYPRYTTGSYLAIYYQLLREVYLLLSPNSGMIFTVLPTLRASKNIFYDFGKFLQSLGCEVILHKVDSYYIGEKDLVMRITKKDSSSPPALPSDSPCLRKEP